MTDVLTDAVNDWLETVGAARLKSVQQTRAFKNVLVFPAIQAEPGLDN